MNFVLLINKTKNKTSRDMVNELNHIFDMKKIGHTGTLDPIATGVLVICSGKYTKLIDKLSSLEKEYIAKIKLGIRTDTGDITGNVISSDEKEINKEDIIKVINSMKGNFEQIIPAYSAKKVNGKKLYEYARNGEDVPIIKNVVEIKNIEFIDYKEDEITFKCLVTKGTYVRSIIESICDKLGVYGCMSDLIRTKQGIFGLDDSYTIEDIKTGNYKFVDIKKILNIDEYKLTNEEYNRVKNGCKMKFISNSNELLLTYDNEVIAIYEKDNDLYKCEIMLN